ncbi:MAG: DUF6268 family outer membrane beta-barrel protein [Bacteroidota bacterium]
MKTVATWLALLWSISLCAQSKPIIFPNDLNPVSNGVKCFCKPGVKNKSRSRGLTISYTHLAGGDFEVENFDRQNPASAFDRFSTLLVDVKIPVINKPYFKLLAGYKYLNEAFTFRSFGNPDLPLLSGLNDKRLKGNAYSLYVSKPLNEKFYLAFRVRAGFFGDYEEWMNFDSRYALLNGLATFGIKKSDDKEWGFGVAISKSFRRPNWLVLPFLFFNKNFNDDWGMEIVLPVSMYLRRNLNPKTIILGGFQFGSQSYSIDLTPATTTTQSYAINHSEVIAQLSVERQLAPWVWANLRAGYQINFSNDFRLQSNFEEAINVDPDNGMIFQIGVFLSPPDRFIK